MSNHVVELDFADEWRDPDKSFRCLAPADSLCHAYYSCDCTEWPREGIIHGKPWHTNWEDESHFGVWKQNECRLEDWFYNSDSPLSGKITVAIDPEWDDGHYEFHVDGEAL